MGNEILFSQEKPKHQERMKLERYKKRRRTSGRAPTVTRTNDFLRCLCGTCGLERGSRGYMLSTRYITVYSCSMYRASITCQYSVPPLHHTNALDALSASLSLFVSIDPSCKYIGQKLTGRTGLFFGRSLSSSSVRPGASYLTGADVFRTLPAGNTYLTRILTDGT